MQYWDLVTRSFRITWDHKYLWLIAPFSGESGASFNFNYSQRQTSRPDITHMREQVMTWISAHTGLIITVAIL